MTIELVDMGRHKEFPERKVVTLPEGTLSRVEAVRREGEDAMEVFRKGLFRELDFREAVEAEVERRLKERLRKQG